VSAAVVPALPPARRRTGGTTEPRRYPTRPMPVPALPAPPARDVRYCLAALDRYGRVADRSTTTRPAAPMTSPAVATTGCASAPSGGAAPASRPTGAASPSSSAAGNRAPPHHASDPSSSRRRVSTSPRPGRRAHPRRPNPPCAAAAASDPATPPARARPASTRFALQTGEQPTHIRPGPARAARAAGTGARQCPPARSTPTPTPQHPPRGDHHRATGISLPRTAASAVAVLVRPRRR
jgi:hypothetical protein